MNRDDEGSITILTLGFLVIALLLVWAVVDASAVFLDRRDLASAADAAALDAAQRVDVQALYTQGVDGDLPLDATAVDAELRTWAAANVPPDWQLSGRVTGPRTITVTATRTVRLPVYGTVTVSAASSATDRTTG